MTNGTPDFPYLRKYMDLNHQQWQRVTVEGLCASCGEKPHVPDEYLCAQCRGPAVAAFQSESPAPRPQPRHRNAEVRKEEREPVKALETVTLAEFALKHKAETAWLVDGLLPLGGLSLMVGAPKTGKSTAARCLAVAIATGGIWLGHKVAARGGVLHLALEERPETIRSHYQLLDAPGDMIHVCNRTLPPPALRAEALDLTMQRLKPIYVVIDTLVRWISIDDANDYAKTTSALDPYLRIAQRHKAHVMFVHHSRKSGGEHGAEALGSTALTGTVDVLLSMKHNGSQRSIYGEGRDGVQLQETTITLDPSGWVISSGTVAETRAEAAAEDVDHKVMEYMRKHAAPATQPEIRQGIAKSMSAVLASLNRLVEYGWLTEETMPGRGKRRLYSLFSFPTPKGAEKRKVKNDQRKDESSLFITDDDVPF